MDPVYLTRAQIGYAESPNPTVNLPYTETIRHTIVSGDYEPDPGFQEVPDDAGLEWVKAACRNVSTYHRRTRGWAGGIGYNHVIFPAVAGAPGGVVCEGQGFGRRGTHTESRNSQWGVAHWGDGTKEPPTEVAWQADEWLIRKALREGKLTASYTVTGHRNYSQKGKSCPGDHIYNQLGRLRGLTVDAPKEWDEMASKAEVEAVVRDVVRAELSLLIQSLTESAGVKPGDTKGVYTLRTAVRDIADGKRP